MVGQTIAELFESASKPLFSFEFFPPKSDTANENLKNTIQSLAEFKPDFATVTYGAGGSTRKKTFEVAEYLRRNEFHPVMPHLTCVGYSREELAAVVDDIYARGFRNIMTLRGDPPRGETTFVPAKDGLHNAAELVELIKSRHPDVCCGVAGYPETHPEATSPGSDVDFLKRKVDAGASFITTQLFFNNDDYFRFVERCQQAGIEVPVLPGLLPANSLKQAARFSKMCGCHFPDELARLMKARGGEGLAAENEGIRWCSAQISDLLERGVPGIHLYILNRARAALSTEFTSLFVDAMG